MANATIRVIALAMATLAMTMATLVALRGRAWLNAKSVAGYYLLD